MTTVVRDEPLEHPWSVPVTANEVPEGGRHFDLVADEHVRAAVARLAGLRELSRFTAHFDVTRFGRDGLHVVGHVSATLGQVCVVTLEPMEGELQEPVDLTFLPQAMAAGAADHGGEVEVSADDAPEPLVNGLVDLGALATEFLILGINPYPRKADAQFEPPAAGDDAGNPFAALAALRKGDGQQ
jgi:uncharacterized metal-binding protein YceD (DUF177 family)